MTASPRNKTKSSRVALGSPNFPVNSTGAYLRHRVAAERAAAVRLRFLWWYRVIVALVICIFYLVIGRDLIALATANKNTTQMEIEHEAQQLRQDLKRLTGMFEQIGQEPLKPADKQRL